MLDFNRCVTTKQEAISYGFNGKISLMFVNILKMIPRIILFTASTIVALLFVLRLITSLVSYTKKTTVKDAELTPAAVVFGAGLWRDGSPTPVLRDRVKTAVDLYNSGKVSRILMSGDNRFEYYNEPRAMRDYALSLGVPEDVIVLDYAGRRTYDTCYRAKHIFKLDNVILVTQNFHLPRALYVCNVLDLRSTGVAADQRLYPTRSLIYWHIRETIATLVAFWEVHITHPTPVLGEPEPIFAGKNNTEFGG